MNTRATVSSVGRAGALPPEALGPARRFASMPDDLDLDCADADRVRLAVRVVVRCFDGLADEAVLRWPVRNRIAAMLRIAEATFGDQLAWESPCAAATCGQPMALSVPLAPTDRRRYSFFASGMRGRGKYTAALRLRKFACASSQSFISWTWSMVEGMSTRKLSLIHISEPTRPY